MGRGSIKNRSEIAYSIWGMQIGRARSVIFVPSFSGRSQRENPKMGHEKGRLCVGLMTVRYVARSSQGRHANAVILEVADMQILIQNAANSPPLCM